LIGEKRSCQWFRVGSEKSSLAIPSVDFLDPVNREQDYKLKMLYKQLALYQK